MCDIKMLEQLLKDPANVPHVVIGYDGVWSAEAGDDLLKQRLAYDGGSGLAQCSHLNPLGKTVLDKAM